MGYFLSPDKPIKVAISACLMGCQCRYDASDNLNASLLSLLEPYELIPFCPEDDAFGSPRPTMDLILLDKGLCAVSNETGENLSSFILSYADAFFDQHPDIRFFIGKDRSPSCGVRTAKIYDVNKKMIARGSGLMAKVALSRGLEALDSEEVCSSILFTKNIDKNSPIL